MPLCLLARQIREYKEEKKRPFFHIDLADPELQQSREHSNSKDR